MAFRGILNGTNNNKEVARIQPASEMIQQDGFKDAVNRQDIDLFVLIGHNPVKPGIPKRESSFPILMESATGSRRMLNTPIGLNVTKGIINNAATATVVDPARSINSRMIIVN
ncbi:hypothetical protein PENVUL_c027G00591 [Penicillium vulpinum]|uniref:Uncharacterized protein n=1 Tax=Penicillium vulpinum TaxID=29845 RepID=A0A1V6RTW7_9EURO|nr:hypothetical protein PENVUL_c027G00591 [Penicillium vulpinum]